MREANQQRFKLDTLEMSGRHSNLRTKCIATDCMLGGQPNHDWQLCFPL